jgi:hypothetical protein
MNRIARLLLSLAVVLGSSTMVALSQSAPSFVQNFPGTPRPYVAC